MNKFDTHNAVERTAKEKLREKDKGKFASKEASDDSVSQGMKRRLEGAIKK
jgi:hypothetical protein